MGVPKSKVEFLKNLSDESLVAFVDRLLIMLRTPQPPAVQKRAEALYDAARAEARRRALKK